jgi:hypothetical protein
MTWKLQNQTLTEMLTCAHLFGKISLKKEIYD